MFIQHTSKAAAFLAALGLCAAAYPIAAQKVDTSSDIVSTHVRLADLNLDTAAGARAALKRVRYGAGLVCGQDPDDIYDGGAQRDACIEDATDRAVGVIGNPTLTAMNGGPREAKTVNLAASRP